MSNSFFFKNGAFSPSSRSFLTPVTPFKPNFLKMNKTFLLFLLVIIINCSTSLGQDKQGNIVEYFGKEKVEDISEGKVLHVFNRGFVLKKENFLPSPASVLSDSIMAAAISGEDILENGKFSSANYPKWEPLEAKENMEFENEDLRSGYLYLEFESPEEQTLIFEASGHTQAIINGLPHEGDHYDFGWSLIPVTLKKGKNKFLLSGGRFNRMRARLLLPEKKIQLTQRDLTLPDVLMEKEEPLLGAIRVINTEDSWLKEASIIARMGTKELKSVLPSVSPQNVRKVPFYIPVEKDISGEAVRVDVELVDSKGETLDTETLELKVSSVYKHHKRTFLSGMDGSVQYYSIAPSLDKDLKNQALFLSVHGASVEAVNQANAYEQKDWGHLVAPTNRRPFGFAWEDWGRLDALEVLSHAEGLLKTNRQRTYLTGHSMGGHGTWYLGATYPDRFAAIAPAAGYPDLLEYRQSFTKRILENPANYSERLGLSEEDILKKLNPEFDDVHEEQMDAILRRAGNPSRTLTLLENYLHYGIYVLHGEVDSVVPTYIAREMRERLGRFHDDFVYYEYPNGTHWYGNHSVDWAPIFYFFKNRTIPNEEDIEKLNFSTASPGVSSGSHFIHILQQEKPFELSSFSFLKQQEHLEVETSNVFSLELDYQKMKLADSLSQLKLNGQFFNIPAGKDRVVYKKIDGAWEISPAPGKNEKGPHRNGGFKDAFRNNMVLVYASNGNKIENEWYYNRARFDAEKFWYRANGNVEIVKDTDFVPENFADRNVILYGNKDNNAAWNSLLKTCPIQISTGQMAVGNKVLKGDQWGSYFIFPRPDSKIASVGVVTATGEKGMKGAYANDYLENGTFFPDLMIFDNSMMKAGISGVKAGGFFGNKWELDPENIYWRP